MVQKEHYTFGDTDLAAERLRLLARVFEPSSARLLASLQTRCNEVAIDLGCGPGHSTRLVAAHSAAERVVGLDQSKKLLAAAAREHAGSRVSFAECDVTAPPFPAPLADLLYSRFLLTHLRDPESAVRTWARAALPGARLVLEETAFMHAENAAFTRYYAHVERMQAHYGQRMYIGLELEALAERVGPEWSLEHSEIAVSPLLATDMARLHGQNLGTWSNDAFAKANYDDRELAQISDSLAKIATGEVSATPVSLGMGQVVLRRT